MTTPEPLSTEELDGIERLARQSATAVRLRPDTALRLVAMARRVPAVCPDCRGSGGYVCEPCDTCYGIGAVWKEGA